MKKRLMLVAAAAVLCLSGCGGAGDSSNDAPAGSVNSKQASVLYTDAKSPTVNEDNKVKTNVSYTHMSATGSRYSYTNK